MLLGPSGCGKSSLLKSIAGFLPPVSGSFHLNGKPIERPGSDRMMVFQEFDQLLPWKTVLGNVMFPLLVNRRMSRAGAREQARTLIAKVNLGAFEDVYPHMLSGGMKQRVAIARALAMEPAVLLMDEPFAALDALTRRKMQEELVALWDDVGFTVIFVTHSIEEALLIGNRILVMSPHPGQVKAELNAGHLGFADLGTQPFELLSRRIQDLLFCRPDRNRARQRGASWMTARLARCRRCVRSAQFAPETMGKIGDVARPLTFIERLTNMTLVRRLVVIVVLAAAWEIYARILDNPLLFPSLTDTLAAFWDSAAHGVLIDRTLTSLRVLGMGYAIGLVAAGVFTTLAVSTRVGTDFLSTLTAMFNPLPAIALLPLALLWFGLGAISIVFVIVHSVLWAVALNTHSGFLSVSPTLRMAGQNCGLTGLSYVTRLLVPAAFPSILTGLKIGWAFAWRTLDRRRAGVRRQLALRRSRLVHLREPQSTGNRQRVCRPAHRHPHRPLRRERDLPRHRECDGAAVGDAELICSVILSVRAQRASKCCAAGPGAQRARRPLRSGSSGAPRRAAPHHG